MRVENWEQRLQRAIDGARTRPYMLGVHDCFTFGMEVIEALTGKHPGWKFEYKTTEEAIAIIKNLAGTFEKAGDMVLGYQRRSPRYARRGDLCSIKWGEFKHLGVCLGEQSAFLSTNGLVFFPTLECICCWRVD